MLHERVPQWKIVGASSFGWALGTRCGWTFVSAVIDGIGIFVGTVMETVMETVMDRGQCRL